MNEENPSFHKLLNQFLEQAKTDNLKTKHYSDSYDGLRIKVSFGQGVSARIPWISILKSPNTTSNGIYPVYLYYKNIGKLILAHGISETIKPKFDWNIQQKITVEKYFQEHKLEKPEIYGSSYIFKVYDTEKMPTNDIIDSNLDSILEIYRSQVFEIDLTSKSYWFVGASFGENSDDQTARFLEEGIWLNGYEDKYLELVRSIKAGDQIAIKSSYTRKKNLPFDNKDHTVSVMGIKAIGVVTKNYNDGRRIEVDWDERFDPVREWYFYTNRSTIWHVTHGEWLADELINFAFSSGSQDIDRFRNAPYWRERFGDIAIDKIRFKWTQFYEAIADGLISYKNDRKSLLNFISTLAIKYELSYLQDKNIDDICPFTVIGIFNRGISDSNRKSIAKELAEYLDVNVDVPNSFEGIPVLNNQKSCFFSFEENRNPEDIDSIWNFFDTALQFSDQSNSNLRTEFLISYDKLTHQYGIGWNITMALYWIRPWSYLTLDRQSQLYIKKKLGVEIGINGPKNRCNAKDYLKVLDELELRFQEDAYPVHSFPELSLAAWLFKDSDTSAHPNATDPDDPDDIEPSEITDGPIELYKLDDIILEGSFIDPKSLEKILERLRTKKNIILQGPPGTGKTWLAKRLAFALIGERNDSKLKAVQFHTNLSYEDFVRGWRPSGEGKLELIDGPLLEMINEAKRNANSKYVIVIEEINRGNPAQIFGEMLTLIEADKRTPNEALELCYRRSDRERVFVPDNLYIIGTMNIADRSIALVDLALRRRFAFIELYPTFGETWRNWVHNKAGIDIEILRQIEDRLMTLNSEIENDKNLGSQFKIGHSYVTPAFSTRILNARQWYQSVVDTEIAPLLNEYWYDDSDKAKNAAEALLEGIY